MDQELNFLDDLDYVCSELQNDAEQTAWDNLIDQIINGNVIPLIGPDILIEGVNLHRKLVDVTARKFMLQSSPSSFSEIIYDHDFLKQAKYTEGIYHFMNHISSKFRNFVPSNILKELLSIKQFPFVMVTSFTPIVENAMREIWGDDLRVLKFSNNPKQNDDIADETDLRKPTVYYMFGKVGERPHRYVLTDNDMLDFCSSWLNDSIERRPQKLVQVIKDKYLLMLGNNYSDWLFRFIWYSITKSGNGEGLVTTENLENELTRFLERNHVFMCQNPQKVIREIKTRLQAKLSHNEETKFDSVEKGVDVFISYSRSDLSFVEKLYKRLSEEGKRVWFDKKNLSYAGDFRNEIKQGIQKARYFIPILSKNVEKERKDPHFYRLEWKEATEMANSLGRTFIIPLAEAGFSYDRAAVDEDIRRHNAIEFYGEEDIEEAVKKIIHIINQE